MGLLALLHKMLPITPGSPTDPPQATLRLPPSPWEEPRNLSSNLAGDRLIRCPVRSIASGFFAHVALVVDGFIRCDGVSHRYAGTNVVPDVRISDSDTRQPIFYLDRRGDDMWSYYFEPTAPWADGEGLLPRGLAHSAGSVPPVDEVALLKMWMRGDRSIFNYYAPRDKYGLPYGVNDRHDVAWHLRSRVRAHHYLHRHVTLRLDVWRALQRLQRHLGIGTGVSGGHRSLGVHMRGSDKRHGLLVGAAIYAEAARRFVRQVPNSTIFVATDDPRALRSFRQHMVGSGAHIVWTSAARSSRGFQAHASAYDRRWT